MRRAWWPPALLLLLAVCAAGWLAWDGEPDGTPGADDLDAGRYAAGFRIGAGYFDDAIAWVERDGPAVDHIESFHGRLDARFDLTTIRRDGPLEVWYRAPDEYRQERVSHRGTTTNIRSGEQAWTIHPDGRIEVVSSADPDGDRVPEVEDTRDLLVFLMQILTVRPLRPAGARFCFAGFKRGTGSYAGNWMKLVRHAPSPLRFSVWVACELDEGHGDLHATWPGVVRLEGDGENGPWTEDWILREWDGPRTAGEPRRFPRRIEGYAVERDEAGGTVPRRFLFAIVDDLAVNEPLDDGLFEPPAPPGSR